MAKTRITRKTPAKKKVTPTKKPMHKGLKLLIALVLTLGLGYAGHEGYRVYKENQPIYKVGDCLAVVSQLTVIEIKRVDNGMYYIQGLAFIFPFKKTIPIKTFHKMMNDQGAITCEELKEQNEELEDEELDNGDNAYNVFESSVSFG